jgi:hypothetical protein
MSFTDDPTTPIGVVRVLIGDLDPEDMELSDESITALLNLYGNNPKITAIYCLQTLANKWTKRELTTKIEGYMSDYRAIAQGYKDRAAELQKLTYQNPMVNSDGPSHYRNPQYPGGWVPM